MVLPRATSRSRLEGGREVNSRVRRSSGDMRVCGLFNGKQNTRCSMGLVTLPQRVNREGPLPQRASLPGATRSGRRREATLPVLTLAPAQMTCPEFQACIRTVSVRFRELRRRVPLEGAAIQAHKGSSVLERARMFTD